MSRVYSGRQDDALGALQLGLAGALKQGPVTLELFAPGQAEGQRVVLEAETFLTAWTRVEAWQRPGDCQDSLPVLGLGKLASLDEVRLLFEKRCLGLPSHLCQVRQAPESKVLSRQRGRRRFPPLRQRPKAVAQRRDQAPYRWLLHQDERPARLVLVKHGVVLEEHPWPEGPRGKTLSLSADHLSYDETGRALLKDAAYQELMELARSLGYGARPTPPASEPAGELSDRNFLWLFGLTALGVMHGVAGAVALLGWGNTAGFAGLTNVLVLLPLVAFLEHCPQLRDQRLLAPFEPGVQRALRWLARGTALLLFFSPMLGLLPSELTPASALACVPLALDDVFNPSSPSRCRESS